MTISTKGIDIIKHFEGLRLTSYQCQAGVWTIGWGTTRYPNGSKVKQGEVIGKEYAQKCLDSDVQKFVYAVDAFTTDKVNQNQFDALVSLCYNIGEAALKGSTLLRKVNINPNDPKIKNEFEKWIRANGKISDGLILRRMMEVKLYYEL